jgi:hypothetical protein
MKAVLQRKCACGGASGPSGECSACKHKGSLQKMLRINLHLVTDLSRKRIKWLIGSCDQRILFCKHEMKIDLMKIYAQVKRQLLCMM